MAITDYTESERKAELLALLLALKENGSYHSTGSDGKILYTLLFTTYQKMIAQDQQNFFIPKQQQSAISTSLQNTIDFYQSAKQGEIKQLLENLKPDDRTSFMILPIQFLTEGEQKHAAGLLIHRHNDQYVLSILDKARFFQQRTGSYLTIPEKNIEKFSELLLDSKNSDEIYRNSPTVSYDRWSNYGILKAFTTLSNEPHAKDLKINLSKQIEGNCIIAGVDAAFKTALYHCHTDIFQTIDTRKEKLTPKYNVKENATFQMRRRFLHALKGNDHNENKKLDRIFSYYEERKKMKKKLLKLNKTWKNSRNPLLKLIYHLKKNSIQKKQYTIHHGFNNMMKRDFSIVPLNGLPKARVQNLIKEDYQKTAIAELYAKVSPSKLTYIQKSKKKDSLSR